MSAPNHRVLVYAMQSSGGSLFAHFLAQHPAAVGIPDLWSLEVIPPELDAPHIVVKITASTPGNFFANIEAFKPSAVLLFLRKPSSIYQSLSTKHYRDDSGPMETQFKTLEHFFCNRNIYFDGVFSYESLTSQPRQVSEEVSALGIPMPRNAEKFNRSMAEIRQSNCELVPWCKRNYFERWGPGNVHEHKLETLETITYHPPDRDESRMVENWCPELCNLYRDPNVSNGISPVVPP